MSIEYERINISLDSVVKALGNIAKSISGLTASIDEIAQSSKVTANAITFLTESARAEIERDLAKPGNDAVALQSKPLTVDEIEKWRMTCLRNKKSIGETQLNFTDAFPKF